MSKKKEKEKELKKIFKYAPRIYAAWYKPLYGKVFYIEVILN